MGRPIWKDTDYNKAMPDWTKAYKATGGAYVWLAKELNALTGGDDYKQGWVNINLRSWSTCSRVTSVGSTQRPIR